LGHRHSICAAARPNFAAPLVLLILKENEMWLN
jgi:hypothetical protein